MKITPNTRIGWIGTGIMGASLVHQLYTTAQALGHGRKGTQALMLALEQL